MAMSAQLHLKAHQPQHRRHCGKPSNLLCTWACRCWCHKRKGS